MIRHPIQSPQKILWKIPWSPWNPINPTKCIETPLKLLCKILKALTKPPWNPIKSLKTSWNLINSTDKLTNLFENLWSSLESPSDISWCLALKSLQNRVETLLKAPEAECIISHDRYINMTACLPPNLSERLSIFKGVSWELENISEGFIKSRCRFCWRLGVLLVSKKFQGHFKVHLTKFQMCLSVI